MTGELDALPSGMLDEDAELVRALVNAHEAMAKRLDGASDTRGQQGQNWTLHLGVPNPDNMPDEPLSVWLHLATASPDQQSPLNADFYNTQWEIYVAARKEDTDSVGLDPTRGLLAVGAIETRLRSTLNDLSLDESIEVETNFNIQHDILRPEEQGEYDLWMIQVGGSLGLVNCR